MIFTKSLWECIFNVGCQTHVSSERLCARSIWRVHLIFAAGAHVWKSCTGKPLFHRWCSPSSLMKHCWRSFKFLVSCTRIFYKSHDEFLLEKKNTEVMLACSYLCVSDSAVLCRGESRVFPRWYQTSTRRHESPAAYCIPSGSTSSESCLWQGMKHSHCWSLIFL